MSKTKRKVRKSFFPKKPTASNMMYYNSLVKVLLVIIIIVVGFVFFHYISFNHHRVKIKIVTTYKDRYIIPENIVFLGDSITHRYNLDKYYSDNNVVKEYIDITHLK